MMAAACLRAISVLDEDGGVGVEEQPRVQISKLVGGDPPGTSQVFPPTAPPHRVVVGLYEESHAGYVESPNRSSEIRMGRLCKARSRERARVKAHPH